MSAANSVFQRELRAYFATPLAAVFLVIFLLLTGVFTFSRGLGSLYQRGQADLVPFFQWHPWLYLFLIPALAMRLWAEERRQGTIELLMTLPVSTPAAVIGKFLAAWTFTLAALLLTFPVWMTVNYLGDPDQGVIIAGYLGSFFMAGGFLAIGSCISALTKNQVIAFVVSVMVCLAFLLAGLPPVIDMLSGWAPAVLVDTIGAFSFFTHFQSIMKGVIELRDLVFFGSLIGISLWINILIVDWKKGA